MRIKKEYLDLKYNIRSEFRKFPDLFVQAIEIVVDSWVCYCYISYEMTNQFFSVSNEQLQQQLEYTLLELGCHSWCISKMQSGREDILEDIYAIKFCLKVGKMPQKRMESFTMLFNHLAGIEHQFLSGIRD